MAWTQDELDSLLAAYKLLLTGAKVVRATVDGAMVEYNRANLADLKAAISEARQDLELDDRDAWNLVTAKGL